MSWESTGRYRKLETWLLWMTVDDLSGWMVLENAAKAALYTPEKLKGLENRRIDAERAEILIEIGARKREALHSRSLLKS